MSAVKVGAAAADVFSRSHGVVALIYHRVASGSGLEVDQPADLFEDQMAALRDEVTVLSLDEAAVALTESNPRQRRVVVTFDDGTVDLVDNALPIMVQHGIPSTWYIATDHIETGRPFPANGTPLSWAALAEAVSTGLVTVGSHTHTHALLDRLPPAAVADELDRSIGLIEERLGIECRHFAYPKALPATGAAEEEVRRRFVTAAVGGTRPNPYGATDLHRLNRSAIQVSDGMWFFRRKVDGGMALEDSLRRLVNRRRYAGATN